jgi:tripeptide aminopeptidase
VRVSSARRTAGRDDPATLTRLVVMRTLEVAAVAGPPLREELRAQVVEAWWRADGLEPRADGVGNRWACVRDGDGPATVVCAHLDTVFEPADVVAPRFEGDRLVGPGVGDDSVALAALSTLDALLPASTRAPVWILATVGEEGIGDLAGIRAALERPPVAVGAVVAVEGNYLGRVCATAVGSVRWRVRVTGAGGHAWEAAEVPSAVHGAARAVAQLADLASVAGGDPKRTVNVGRFEGGDGINVRAPSATFEVDLRAADPEVLAELVAAARLAVAAAGTDGCSVDVTDLGARPAGYLPTTHPLVEAAVGALSAAGLPARLVAASTDANAAHAAGLPAIAVGVTEGAGEHTTEEWIAVPPIGDGLAVLADTVARWDAHQAHQDPTVRSEA